ncbi:MAG TPA: hypothetical protein VN633_11055 [Bryobacteraceae bacterium]|nr:hypothetical protein [Bryobacteraceae bacterium]
MSFAGAALSLLQKYAGGQSAAGADVQQDFEKVASTASSDHVAGGLAEAFKSDQTPPFAEMVAKLFSQSNGEQRAGLINQLLSSSGGGGISSLLSGGIAGQLTNLLGGGNQISPEAASQVSPEEVKKLAETAHQNNPSIIDTVSSFYSQHPGLVKALGAGALALVMARMHEKL